MQKEGDYPFNNYFTFPPQTVKQESHDSSIVERLLLEG